MNRDSRQSYEDLLPFIKKPSQYLGEEVNAIKKDLGKVQTNIALVFPDLYEIGMAHLGLKILYNIINKREEYAAERVFAPDLDYEELLREKGMALASLENRVPLNKFDIVGFTLQYEMSYSNVLNILDLSGIPLLSKERGGEYPLVIGGGPCAYNPEPIADFFDCFVIGDGEEIIIEILDRYSSVRKQKKTKEQLLHQLAEIKGVYVPSMFEVEYFEGGEIRKSAPKESGYPNVEKRILHDLNKAEYPVTPVTPFTNLVHDRVSIEIDRGCTRACRFCQAGYIYRPVRERSVEKIIELSEKALDNTGYSELSLLSLSSGDYSKINELLPKLVQKLSSNRVSLSLPSLQPSTITETMIECIRRTGKTGFTISVESGSRLRNVLNKDISEEEILAAAENIARSGCNVIKLYFMVGLPTETMDDLEEIYTICTKVYSRAKKANKGFKKLNIGISFFVPKSHTPFQWVSQVSREDMEIKLGFLKSKFKSRSKYDLSWQNPGVSFLEGVFARGDRRLGKVLINALQLGCKFDGWSERFDFEKWMAAFEKAQMDATFYTERERSEDEVFPWDFINTGVKKEYLLKEYMRSKEGIKEEDCRKGKCFLCGLEKICSDINSGRKVSADSSIIPTVRNSITLPPTSPEADSIGVKYRVHFSKTSLARHLSHFETRSALTRALRRAKIPFDYSKGFHPRPKISFDFALPVGMESKEEYFDVVLTSEMAPESIMRGLNNEMPLGMIIRSVTEIPLNSKPLSVINNKIHFKIYLNGIAQIQPLDLITHKQRLADFLSDDKIKLFPENGGTVEEILYHEWFDSLDIEAIDQNGLVLKMVTKIKQGKFVSPRKLLRALYPEFNDDRGNYRVVKEATYHAV